MFYLDGGYVVLENGGKLSSEVELWNNIISQYDANNTF